MGDYDFNLRVLVPYLPVLGWGAWETLKISALAILFSFPLGLIGALMRISSNRLAQSAAGSFVEIVRNIPLLVVLYILYYALPQHGVPINAFTAGVLGLTINSAAYSVEIFRGGFAAIPAAQHEAARALGLSRLQIMRLVIVPQVFRIVLPSLGNQIVSVVLGSAQASIIGVTELTYQTQSIGSKTFRYFELFSIAALFYIVCVQVISQIWRAISGRGAHAPLGI
ncbi:MAG TPA: amino acid ABC transporter permease [Stellaceae bacterium]|jgi:polar amino acid transport system permease protein|nr:amino acid ABC transporter permease [Stellaceae bacterium]